MPKKKKPFIDKKKSVTFHLVHRSQKDPLVAADDRGLVLAPVDGVERLSINNSSSGHNKSASSGSTRGHDDDDPDSPTTKSHKNLQERIKYGIYFDDDYDYLQHLKDANEVYTMEKQDLDEPIEQRYRINKDGTTIDAGKDIGLDRKGGNTRLSLPASLFESQGVELKTGLLNQAAPLPGPHPELDPDVIAALDDENFDFDNPDNLLEDDFVSKANASSPAHEETTSKSNRNTLLSFSQIAKKADSDQDESESDDNDEDQNGGGSDENWETDNSEDEDEDNNKNGSKNKLSYYEKWSRDRKYFGGKGEEDDNLTFNDKEETKSRFTNYSLTSSVMRRSGGLKQVDAVFEKLYEQYDEEELGELENDDNEIAGFIDPESERMAELIKEHERNMNKDKLTAQELFSSTNKDVDVNNHCLQDDALINSEEKICIEVLEDKPKEKWDCESILSTYSTLYNRPTLIVEPPSRKRIHKKSAAAPALTLDPKTGLPVGVFKSPNLGPILAKLPNNSSTANNIMDIDEVASTVTSSRASTIKRSRFETTEERRDRKSLIKVERKERRMEKKQNKLAFKTESIRLKQQDSNVKQNLTGIRLA